jgi:hypothetical protein
MAVHADDVAEPPASAPRTSRILIDTVRGEDELVALAELAAAIGIAITSSMAWIALLAIVRLA